MHAVIETFAYLRAAEASGMTQDERDAVVTLIAANPEVGDVLQGTGGARKVRVAAQGRGKSGGYRVITFYSGPNLPAFLVPVFAKGDKVNLTKGERNALARLTKLLASTDGRQGASGAGEEGVR